MTIFYPVPYAFEVNGEYEHGEYESDPYTCYKIKPNWSGFYPNGIPVRCNSLGLYNKEITFEKKDGTFRILVLGDSFTAGSNIRVEQAYLFLLEKILNKTCRVPVEVINAGVGGWDPFMYAQYYEHYGRKIEHDMVLVGFFVGNDTYDITSDFSQCPKIVLGRRVYSNNPISATLKVFFYKHSNIVRLLMNTAPPIRNFARKDCDDIGEFSLWINKIFLNAIRKQSKETYLNAKHAVDEIKRIKDLADQNAIPLVIALLPDEKRINKTLQKKIIPDSEINLYDFSMPQSMLIKIFDERGIKIVDLLPAFFRKH